MSSKALSELSSGPSLLELFESGFLSSYAVRHLNKYQKAAIFLVTVGTETAVPILRNLAEEDIEPVAAAIVTMTMVPSDVRLAVLDELEHSIASNSTYSGGPEYVRSLLQKAFGEKRSANFLQRLKLTEGTGKMPFATLQKLEPEEWQALLAGETSTTVALILSCLPPHLTGLILKKFALEFQQDLTAHMVQTQSVQPEILQAIEASLLKKYQTHLESSKRTGQPKLNVTGLNQISEILSHSPSTVANKILDGIGQSHSLLSEQIRQDMFGFEDLNRLSDISIRLLLQRIDNQKLAYALKIASPPLKEKFFRNMSQQAMAMLQEDIKELPPTLRSEILKQQQLILQMAQQLEREGKLSLSRQDEDKWIE